MKYLLSTAILASVCLDTFAQETLQTVTSRGNTTNMSLQIGGASVNANTTKLFINNPSGKNWALSSGANNLSEQGFYIYNWSDNPSTPLFSLDNAGHVGIGTFSPQAALDVKGLIQISGINSSTPPSDLSYGLFPYGGVGLGIFSGAGDSNQGIGIWTNPNGTKTEVMRILSGGNVGIGINSPTEKLEVAGRIKGGDRIYANSDNIATLGLIQSYNSAGGAAVLRAYSGASYWDFGSNQSVAGNSLLIGAGISESANNAAITVLQNKNVGIGTLAPDEKLTVKGKIHAEEVKVDLSVPGPDYVFNADYPLTPLSEIQTYIKANRHLPEVPSAKEMEEKGINLSEMNMLLLKKVEELTLHLIAQDKINQAQNDMLLELKKSNALLMEQFKQVNNK